MLFCLDMISNLLLNQTYPAKTDNITLQWRNHPEKSFKARGSHHSASVIRRHYIHNKWDSQFVNPDQGPAFPAPSPFHGYRPAQNAINPRFSIGDLWVMCSLQHAYTGKCPTQYLNSQLFKPKIYQTI